jgi:6-phosphogluconolactonase
MIASRQREIRGFADLEALSQAAAKEIADVARASVAERGRFSVSLSGGNTPKRTYQLLVERYRDAIDWGKTDIVFGDERFVPHDDPRSNYRMAREAFLASAPIPAERVYAVETDAPTVDAAAARYEGTLRDVLAPSAATSSTIDLVLLGVGPDGHTASLFPGSPALNEREHWTRAVAAPTTVQPAVPRVTVTLPFLNGARHVLFLVAGADKRPVVAEILEDASAARYPAAMVAPAGRSLWMVERSAMPPERT